MLLLVGGGQLGCATGGGGAGLVHRQKWIEQRGRLVAEPAAADRLASAVQRLGLSADELVNVRVQVLGSRHVAAYAWEDGAIYVTLGLLETMDDDECAAALAHELGHLIDDGHIRCPQALAGRSPWGVNHESRADLIGCALLEQAGVDAQVMLRMLVKLKSSVSKSLRPAIQKRIEAVERSLAEGKLGN